jgi:hypothetical protein
MSLVKLAAQSRDNNQQGGLGGWAQRHPYLASGIALTGGIAAADAGLAAWKARHAAGPVFRQKVVKGLKEGAMYGGILSTVEPLILHGAFKKKEE